MNKRKYVKKENVDDLQPIDKALFDKMLKASTFIKPPKDGIKTSTC